MSSPSDTSRSASLRTGPVSRIDRLRGSDDLAWRGMVDDLMSSSGGAGLLIAAAFAILASAAVLFFRSQLILPVGRVADETRLVRVRLESVDVEQTRQEREAARQSTPRVYVASNAVLDSLVVSLENLPRTLAGVADLSAVDPTIVQQFGLTPELLAAIRAEATEGQGATEWSARVAALVKILKRRPMLDAQTWQRAVQEGTHTLIRVVCANEEPQMVFRGEVINVEDKSLAQAAEIFARDAGFVGPLRRVVANRLVFSPRPTFTFDEAGTTRQQDAAAAAVPDAVKINLPGQVMFRRGDVLTAAQADLFAVESRRFDESAETWRVWVRHISLLLVVGSVSAALVGYTRMFCPRIRQSVPRMLGAAGFLLFALGAAGVLTVAFPTAMAATSVLPTVLVSIIISIGYDRRAALAFGILHGLLVCTALDRGLPTIVVMITGIACVVTTMRDIRDRSSLLRMSVTTGLGVAAATIVMAMISRPLLVSGAWDGATTIATDPGIRVLRETVTDAGLVVLGVLAIGGGTMLFLPSIERAFDVTTGMTLMELRDPKQPLLRELQRRAAGTYNHSLNVASIAEAAAESIGADPLLTYVGALFHDVGKMNKPEYFVENQQGGINRHDRLSPAMSLLVVVGHVKDGLELAREYGLPRSIQHFIEAHHGTTLVEYFYHRARKQAIARGDSDDDAAMPDEVEYRYPGPRPRTKEVAILMIADAVESATRAMSDPTPSRIEALVRGLANKRLLDGQFDECELTLRELTQIVESVTRTLASMYHGRVAYPTSPAPEGALTGEVVVESKRA